MYLGVAMPTRLDVTVVARIEDDLRNPPNIPNRQYLQQLAIDYHTTLRIIYRHKLRIDAEAPVCRHSGGPRRVISSQAEQAIKLLLDERPWFYLDEIQEFLLEAFDINVCLLIISSALRRIRVTRKRLKAVTAQRNAQLRNHWQEQIQYFSAEQIVCVDESGSDNRTGDRTFGWSDSGAKAIVHRWLAHRTRVSVLPAYTINGYITAQTFYGTCTGEIFEEFIINRVLPLCNPYPGPRSVIIMDNASIHHSFHESIQEACRRRGVWIRFLPPYSPDFNPIEESFGDLKAFIRRHYRKK